MEFIFLYENLNVTATGASPAKIMEDPYFMIYFL